MVEYTVAYNEQHRIRKAVASLVEQSALEQECADAYLKYSLQTLILKSYDVFVCGANWSKDNHACIWNYELWSRCGGLQTAHGINLISDLLCKEGLHLPEVMKSFFLVFVPYFVCFRGFRINVLFYPCHEVSLMPY